MRRIYAYGLTGIISASFSCTSPQPPVKDTNIATEIVKRSIESHGGWGMWSNTQVIKYTKRIILYDSLGSVESDVTQFHNYRLRPDLEGSITWQTGGTSHEVFFSNGKGWKVINGNPSKLQKDSVSATNTMRSSHFVLLQPFKLLDPGVTLVYLGIDTLANGRIVDVIRAIYGPDGKDQPGADRWSFYFDRETALCVANMVDHAGRYSFIENLTYDSTTDLVLHRKRKSSFVDSLRNVKYLRAEYVYENFDLQ